MGRYGWFIAVAVGIAVSTTGCGGQKILTHDQVKYPKAVKLYENGCITCHGDNLQGGIGPNLQHVGAKLSTAQIGHIITHGSGPMPAYALPGDAILTQAQIQSITQWLATQK